MSKKTSFDSKQTDINCKLIETQHCINKYSDINRHE